MIEVELNARLACTESKNALVAMLVGRIANDEAVFVFVHQFMCRRQTLSQPPPRCFDEWAVCRRELRAALELHIEETSWFHRSSPVILEHLKKQNDDEFDRLNKSGIKMVVFIIANEEWSYVIGLQEKGQVPDPEMVNTVRASIRLK